MAKKETDLDFKDPEKPTDTVEKETQQEETGFSSAFDPGKTSLNNKNIRAITENFIIDYSAELSGFVGRVFEIQFIEIKYIETKKVFEKTEPMIYCSFHIGEQAHHGLITFEPLLLHKVINFLFGADEQMEDENSPIQFGQCALKIARKIADLSLLSLQKAVVDIKKIDATLIDSNNNPKAIRSQNIPDKAYQMVFNISGMQANNLISIIFPESFIEQITYQSDTGASQTQQAHKSPSNQLQNDLIDSSIDLIALLPDIKLKLTEVMNLKAGDLIPIQNPEQVELKLGQKKRYKAIVGQANERRVVKITDTFFDAH